MAAVLWLLIISLIGAGMGYRSHDQVAKIVIGILALCVAIAAEMNYRERLR
jgi:hypothetical protein